MGGAMKDDLENYGKTTDSEAKTDSTPVTDAKTQESTEPSVDSAEKPASEGA